jgi:Uma2 family endonuclease
MPRAKKTNKKFSYTDYMAWPDDERWELINGVAYDMTPAPSVTHQRIVGNLFFQVRQKLAETPCTAFVAPTDVVFSEHDVVQPDIFVVCDEKKITEKNVDGAPDLIIEVLSAATARKDRWEKKNLYEKYRVKEYILIEPDAQFAEHLFLGNDGAFGKGRIFGPQEVLKLTSLEDIGIPLWEVFEVEGPENSE